MQGSFNVGWPHLSTVFESSAQTGFYVTLYTVSVKCATVR